MYPRDPAKPPLDRRRFLGITTATLAWVATGCSGSDDAATVDSESSTPSTGLPSDDSSADRALAPADFEALGTCLLLPEMTAGPFPTREPLDRRDVTEGHQGRPLRLGLRVVDDVCEPVPGSAVEIWHADASGDYSSYEDGGTGKDEGPGTTFLRGIQVAGDDGIVDFATIYPGWYAGRAVHIHARVHRNDQLVLTTQLFFPDEVNREVLATGPYAEFGQPDTTDETDTLGGDIAGNGSLLHVASAGSGDQPDLLALLNLGVPG